MGDPALSLSVYTTIKFSADLLKRVTGLAYFYDSNWLANHNQNGFDAGTLPFAFIHVTKDEVTQTSNVSTKRIILYEEKMTTEEAKNKVRPSVLEVVADNVVNEPPFHNIEGIIPTTYLSKMFSGLSGTISTAMEYIYGATGVPKDVMNVTEGIFDSLSTTADYISKLSNFVSTFMPSWSATYNVDSLFTMQSNRTFVAYKTWEGFGRVKYGVIKNFRTYKVPEEDDYYRFTMEFHEVPVMAIGTKDLINDNSEPLGKFDKFLVDSMNGLVKNVSGLLGGNL